MRTPPLHRPVVNGSTVVLCLALLVTGVVTYLVLRLTLEAQLQAVLDARVDAVEVTAAALDDPAQLAAALGAQGVRAVVHAADGTMHIARPPFPRIVGNLPVGPVAAAVVRADVPLPGGGSVEVSVSRDGVDAALGRLAALLVGVGAATALLPAVLLRWTARSSLQPLEHVAAVADTIAAGSYDQRLEPDQPDTVLGRTAAAIDRMVDALQRALAGARRAEASQRRFLDDAAHQLRTPLTRVVSVAEVLPMAPPEQRDALAGTIAEEGHRAAAVVGRLLDLARAEHHDPTDREPLDLTAVLRHEVARARDLAPHLVVRADLGEPLTVHADAARLRDAVANLLDNARRHAGAAIDVVLHRDEDAVTIEVRDDGPGMDAAAAARAFERFASLDAHGGSGLGLPIAAAAAAAHGGDLVYERPSFRLRLPLAAPSPAHR